MHTLYHGDCLVEMGRIADGSIDLVLADVPYGTTQCKWDTVIPFEPMWEHLNRVIKKNGAIVLFGSEPFSSFLRVSNIEMYKYDWTWQKSKKTGFLNAKKQPLNDNELISVFYQSQCLYNPQKTIAKKVHKRGFVKRKQTDVYGKERDFRQIDDGYRYPTRIIFCGNADTREQYHPTQKPVALMEYLIRTYTNEGETVLDFTMGSGTTGIACINTGRDFIGIELDAEYFEIAKSRIENAQPPLMVLNNA